MKCALRLALRKSRIALQRNANEPMRNTPILAYGGCRHALFRSLVELHIDHPYDIQTDIRPEK